MVIVMLLSYKNNVAATDFAEENMEENMDVLTFLLTVFASIKKTSGSRLIAG